MVEIVIKVPKEYIQDAEDFGMLDAETVAKVLRAELDDRIMKFVDAEVKSYRKEHCAKRANTQARPQ